MAKKQSKVVDSNSLMINEEVLRDKIYSIRGQKVMLDYDLAEIYGYTTKAFNQQVKNNAEKFDGDDFMFKLTRSEINNLVKYSSYALSDSDESVRSKKLTSRDGLFTGQDGGARYLPHAFTEQGIYMLMTVLRGELAVKQSRALIRMFKAMKDYIIENQELSKYKNNLAIMERVIDDSRSIEEIRGEIKRIDSGMEDINKRIDETVKTSEISPLLLDFKRAIKWKEFIFTGYDLMKASEMYMRLYSMADKSIDIIDDYVSIKTLRHLRNVGAGVRITIISDNKGRYLHREDYEDYQKDCRKEIKFIRTEGKVHDRFIVLDYGTGYERVYYFGASEKDAGGKISVMSRLDDGEVRDILLKELGELRKNRELVL